MRLLCSCCVAEVLRICAPNIPYSDKNVKVVILLFSGRTLWLHTRHNSISICLCAHIDWYVQRVFKLLISQFRRFLGKPEGPSFERIVSVLEAIVKSESQIILVNFAESGDESLLVDLYDALLESAWYRQHCLCTTFLD